MKITLRLAYRIVCVIRPDRRSRPSHRQMACTAGEEPASPSPDQTGSSFPLNLPVFPEQGGKISSAKLDRSKKEQGQFRDSGFRRSSRIAPKTWCFLIPWCFIRQKTSRFRRSHVMISHMLTTIVGQGIMQTCNAASICSVLGVGDMISD
jgi:hypothetical protein